MSKKAVIEISPDFIRFLVGELEGKRLSAVLRNGRMNRLSISDRVSRFQTENQVSLAVLEYAEIARGMNAELCGVYFSALMGSSSAVKSLQERIRSISGAACTILDAEYEARCLFAGTLNSRSRPPERMLLLRIAPEQSWIIGGSRSGLQDSEIADVNAKSLGTRLMESENGPETLKKIHNNLCDRFSRLSAEFGVPLAAVGEAASIASMLNLRMDKYDVNVIHSSRVKFAKIDRILSSVANAPPAMRPGLLKGTGPYAAEAAGGLCMLRAIMENIGARRIMIAETALLAGILISLLVCDPTSDTSVK